VILHDPASEPESPKMAEVVAEKIRVRIAHRELEAGDPLPSETVLLAEYGVARPTMREALRILESEGLLTVKRGKGGGPRIAVPRVYGVAKQAGFLLQVSGTPLGDVLRARRVIEVPPSRTSPR
jgi:DNA-binding FadR family transcriptional regulator